MVYMIIYIDLWKYHYFGILDQLSPAKRQGFENENAVDLTVKSDLDKCHILF